jgi:hypothetical protein
MAKKSPSKKKSTRLSQKPSAIRPMQLYDRFIDSDDQKERLVFEARYNKLRDRELQDPSAADSASLLSLLHRLDPFATVEDAIRRASFVQGFEVCASLLSKGGAR